LKRRNEGGGKEIEQRERTGYDLSIRIREWPAWHRGSARGRRGLQSEGNSKDRASGKERIFQGKISGNKKKETIADTSGGGTYKITMQSP